MKTILELAAALAAGHATATSLTESCLANIADEHGEGKRAFIKVYAKAALEAARQSDRRREKGEVQSVLEGIPISIKDLFDVKGEVTRAGSIFFDEALPVEVEAPSIARLRAAGAIIIGRTNMTEFAYGAHGTNKHYGTPLNAFDRASERIPGGSTSGGAVSVTDRMAAATIGSDTGGSVRIPAALCGLAGYKPTQARVPLAGAFPLSHTRDSIGPLGVSAACCVLLDHAMADEPIQLPDAASLKGLTFGVPINILFDGLTPAVEHDVARALSAISRAGAHIREFHFQELQDELDGSRDANFSGYEGYHLHRERLADHLDMFDPWVSKRLLLGANIKDADYQKLLVLRQKLIASANKTTASYDALLAPTVPIVAPTIEALMKSEEDFYRINSLLLRNTAPFNVLDRPAWSLPCHESGSAPTGLMVVGETNADIKLQRLGLAIEAAMQVKR
jgi:aspartyl-tRNA(Asn)/glutamyl-tRNA(Gln) amidotransferase subunit A